MRFKQNFEKYDILVGQSEIEFPKVNKYEGPLSTNIRDLQSPKCAIVSRSLIR